MSEKYTVLSYEDERARAIERSEQVAANLAAARDLQSTLLDEEGDPDPRVAVVAELASQKVGQRIESLSRALNIQRSNLSRWNVETALAEIVASVLADEIKGVDAVYVGLKAPDRIEDGVQLYVVAEGDLMRRTVAVQDGGTSRPVEETQGRVSIVFSAPDTRREIDVRALDRIFLAHDLVVGAEGKLETHASNSGDRFTQTIELPNGAELRHSEIEARKVLHGRREAHERGTDRNRYGVPLSV